jgi:hypothetical protein
MATYEKVAESTYSSSNRFFLISPLLAAPPEAIQVGEGRGGRPVREARMDSLITYYGGLMGASGRYTFTK